MIEIEPVKGRILVKLGVSDYGDIPVPEKSYDSVTYGEILKVHPDDTDYLDWVGKTGYWKLYSDDLRVGKLQTGEKLALIYIDKVDGTSNVESN